MPCHQGQLKRCVSRRGQIDRASATDDLPAFATPIVTTVAGRIGIEAIVAASPLDHAAGYGINAPCATATALFRRCIGAAGVFPLSLGGQREPLARPLGQPLAKRHRPIPRYADHRLARPVQRRAAIRVILAFAVQVSAVMSRVEQVELLVGDHGLGDPERAFESYAAGRSFVRRPKRVAHHELARGCGPVSVPAAARQ